MKKIAFYLLLLICYTVSYSQNEDEIAVFQHHVKPGETVKMLSKKYLVTPSNIYALNKFAVNGIREGMTLDIPINEHSPQSAKNNEISKNDTNSDVSVANPEEVDAIMDEVEKQEQQSNSVETDSDFLTHHVKAGETLSSISRKYGISISEIQAQNNSVLAKGLKAGQKLKIATNNNSKLEQNIPANTTEHKVLPGETLFSISKKYGISVDAIKQQNEKILARGLQAGLVIEIKPNN